MARLTHPLLAIVIVGSACAGAVEVPGQQDSSVFSSTIGPQSDTGDTDDDTATSVDPSVSTSVSTTVDSDDSMSTTDPTDSDTDGPPPGCGNAVLEGDEECDLGPRNSDTGPCRSDCTNPICGDGFVGPGEACDDANGIDDDECSNQCLLTTCGDAVVNGGVEQCDDGNDDDTDACPGTCLNARCGDGFVQAGVDQCDEAAVTATCDGDCTTVSCGDGTTNAAAGEGCDDGNGDPNDACTTNCLPATCGDGFTQGGVEACDDGNDESGDGCSADCQFEFPDVCEAGADPGTGSAWVVCSANANTAWVSANAAGNYHPVLICNQLGYNTVGQWGGTCGNVCGYCQGPTSCEATGSQTFDLGNWAGAGNCGADGLGPIICVTVMWTCVN